jgi:hypothetical protein
MRLGELANVHLEELEMYSSKRLYLRIVATRASFTDFKTDLKLLDGRASSVKPLFILGAWQGPQLGWWNPDPKTPTTALAAGRLIGGGWVIMKYEEPYIFLSMSVRYRPDW